MTHDDDDYTGPERRRLPTMDAVALMIARELEANEGREVARWEQAFPGGDIKAHCSYHQSIINAAEEQQRFWEDARRILLSKGIDGMFAVLKVVLLLAVVGAASKIGLALPFFGKG